VIIAQNLDNQDGDISKMEKLLHKEKKETVKLKKQNRVIENKIYHINKRYKVIILASVAISLKSVTCFEIEIIFLSELLNYVLPETLENQRKASEAAT